MVRSKQKQTKQVTEAEKQVVEGIAAFRKLSRDIRSLLSIVAERKSHLASPAPYNAASSRATLQFEDEAVRHRRCRVDQNPGPGRRDIGHTTAYSLLSQYDD